MHKVVNDILSLGGSSVPPFSPRVCGVSDGMLRSSEWYHDSSVFSFIWSDYNKYIQKNSIVNREVIRNYLDISSKYLCNIL